MRILILTDHYPPFYEGGYELDCHEVAQALMRRGHTIQVLTSRYGLEAPTRSDKVHRTLHFLAFEDEHWVVRLRKQAGNSIRVRQNYAITRRAALRFKPELAFVWNIDQVSILPALAVQDLGIPTVYRLASHWLVHRWHKYVLEPSWLKRWYRSAMIGFRRFDEFERRAAIMVSETLRQSHQEAGLDFGQSAVVWSGLPNAWFARQPGPHPSPNETIKLLFAGRLEQAKGADLAIEAVRQLVHERGCPNVQLDMIGKGEPGFVATLDAYVQKNGLQRHVRREEFLPREQLVQRYAGYHVLMFPSLQWEGLPLTILEAMSQGLLVIASDIGGPRDIIQHRKNGLLVSPRDPFALAEAVAEVMATPDQAMAMRKAGLELVRQECGFEHMVDRYEKFLRSVLYETDIGASGENSAQKGTYGL